jgi:hypothetical protein
LASHGVKSEASFVQHRAQVDFFELPKRLFHWITVIDFSRSKHRSYCFVVVAFGDLFQPVYLFFAASYRLSARIALLVG